MNQECINITQCERFQDAYSYQGFVNSDMPASTCAFIHGTALRNILFSRYVELRITKLNVFRIWASNLEC